LFFIFSSSTTQRFDITFLKSNKQILLLKYNFNTSRHYPTPILQHPGRRRREEGQAKNTGTPILGSRRGCITSTPKTAHFREK